jgi:hypothetical protein
MKSFLKNYKKKIATAFLVVAVVAIGTSQASILGSAESFAVLGGSAVSNTPTSTIVGNVGVYSGTAISGFNFSPLSAVPDPQVTGGLVHATTDDAHNAQTDATKAYNGLKNMTYDSDPWPAGNNLTGQDLGTLTLPSGVYHFDGSAQLTGTLTLDANGNNNAYWVFQIYSTLTTGPGSVVQMTGLGPDGGFGAGVFWQVGSSATIDTTTAFEGNILALVSITLNNSATILNGRALAQTAVTLDHNTIKNVCPLGGPGNGGPGFSGGLKYDTDGTTVVPIPEPATLCLLGFGALSMLRRKR